MELGNHLIRFRKPNSGRHITVLGHVTVSLCSLLQTERMWVYIIVGWHVWEQLIKPTEIWIIFHHFLKHWVVMFYLSLLSLVSLPFLFRSRPKGGSAEERKGATEVSVIAFRPDVAYNLLHTLFYGLLAFSTMRWAHAHMSNCSRFLDSHTF